MGKLKKAELNRIEKIFKKAERKPKFIPYKTGKCTFKIESAYFDKTKEGDPCIKWEVKFLSGPNDGRTYKKTSFLIGRTDDDTQRNSDWLRADFDKLGFPEECTVQQGLDLAEDVEARGSMWDKDGTKKFPLLFFTGLVDNNAVLEKEEEEEEEESTNGTEEEEGDEYEDDEDEEEEEEEEYEDEK